MIRRAGVTLFVALLAAGISAATFTVTNTATSGSGSLHAAMTSANADSGSTINFNIPGEQPFVISIDSFAATLPVMIVPVTIDATTQPGYEDSPVVSVVQTYCHQVINHTNCLETPPMVQLNGGTSTVRGLELAAYQSSAIVLQGSSNVVELNKIRAVGPARSSLEQFAVDVNANDGTQVKNNTIMYGRGVRLLNSDVNQVQGNTFHGTYFEAIVVAGTSNDNAIGGTGLNQGNVADLAVDATTSIMNLGASGNTIQGNTLSNQLVGIQINGEGNLVGGIVAGAGNTIHNVRTGVAVQGTGNGIRRNSIHSLQQGFPAGSISIDNSYNVGAPTLTDARVLPTQITIYGSLTRAPGDYVLEFFASESCPQPWARTYLGSLNLAVPPAGTTTFTATFPVLVEIGTYITSTATESNGSTSTVSACVITVGDYPTQPPPNLTATAVSTSEISVTWNPVDGATSYEVFQSFNNSPFQSLGTTTNTFMNVSGLMANTTYLFKIKSISAAGPSAFSAVDAATTIIFTDELTAGLVITSVHLAELRIAVNAMRAGAGLSQFSFTDPTLTTEVTVIKAVHVDELRSALNAARSTIGLPPLPYTNVTLTPGVTAVRAIHLVELRGGVQ